MFLKWKKFLFSLVEELSFDAMREKKEWEKKSKPKKVKREE